MVSREFGPTIRDFSKTSAARNFLATKFKFEALPPPNLLPLQTNEDVPANLLGATFDYLLLLLIECCNRDFAFQNLFSRKFKDGRSKLGQGFKDYLKTGALSDVLVDELISYGESHQRSFQPPDSQNRLIISDSLRNELRRMHTLTAKIDWNIKKSFQRGWLTSSHHTVLPDLILDNSLFEVKAVKNAERHNEYLSQLFVYYIMSETSIKKQPVPIDEVGIYYARHGVLVKNKTAEIIRFPPTHIKRISFDFMVEFQCWRDGVHPTQKDKNFPKTELETRRCYSFNHVLASIHPKSAWLEKALEGCFKKTKRGLVPQPIKIPQDFLID